MQGSSELLEIFSPILTEAIRLFFLPMVNGLKQLGSNP
jgi:hypothetical protein